MISTEKKLIFLHIPKTGGASVQTELNNYCNGSDKDMYVKYFHGHHIPFSELKNRMYKDNQNKIFDEYNKICIVRNPWDWHVSWYHYLKQTPPYSSGYINEYNLCNNKSFNDYIKWLCDVKKTSKGKPELNMLDWVVNENGDIIPNDIIKYETLNEDLIKYGLNIPHINKSIHKGFKTYYNDETIELVRDKHKLDIEHFKYEF
jgi:hypothetical protein